jgi:inward rectifier potassium channel
LQTTTSTNSDGIYQRHILSDLLYGLIILGMIQAGSGRISWLALCYLTATVSFLIRSLPHIALQVNGSMPTVSSGPSSILPWISSFLCWAGLERVCQNILSGWWVFALGLSIAAVYTFWFISKHASDQTESRDESIILTCWPGIHRQTFHFTLLLLSVMAAILLCSPNHGMNFLLQQPHAFLGPMLAIFYLLLNHPNRNTIRLRDHSSGLLTLAGALLSMLLVPLLLSSICFNIFFQLLSSNTLYDNRSFEIIVLMIVSLQKISMLLLNRRGPEGERAHPWSYWTQTLLASMTIFFSILWLIQVQLSLFAGVSLEVVGFTLINSLLAAEFLFDARWGQTSAQDGAGIILPNRQTTNVKSNKRANRQSFGKAIRRGVSVNLRNDMYYYFIEASWPKTFLLIAISYLLTNTFFAIIYTIVPGSIAGAKDNSLFDAFFFSVQTLSTVGYGALHPNNLYGNMIVTIEAACGLIGVAVVTGLVFSKISRPKSGVLFSRPIVVTSIEGRPHLAFRVGNTRGNDVVDANLTFTVLLNQKTQEGHNFRRMFDLKLVRQRTPFFSLSWTVMHPLDQDSPLRELVEGKIPENLVALMAILIGHDSSYSATVYARHSYLPEDIRFNQHFVDVLSEDDEGQLVIDYSKFNDITPLS